MKTLADKIVLLTGASGGIGVHLARALAREGATIICVSRSQDGLDRVCAEVEAVGGKSIALPFDLSKVEELSFLVQQIDGLVGAIDILINNAAIAQLRAFKDSSLPYIQSILATNLLAAMELTRLLLPGMLSRGSGHLVNIASLAGKKGMPYDSVYSASKAGLIIWADALRQELADTPIGVSTICPGYVSAGMFLTSGMSPSKLVTVSAPTDVANAVIAAIKQNQPEVVVDGSFTKLLFAIGQLSPQFLDTLYWLLGIKKRSQKCIENNIRTEIL